ncbi:hypothetical protein [Streptomyces arboris]|uniref:hypothetical protein n=1 Tax=Streptomyces arboris TaxID=2600619 RepID=UPI001CEF874D|nr:hypothetical protein [Streptomyces arboris]
MRALGLEVNDTNHRRVRRKIVQLKLDTGHFIRRSWTTQQVPEPRAIAPTTLVVKPSGSSRTNRTRLHRALQEVGVTYRCVVRQPGRMAGTVVHAPDRSHQR